MNENMKTPPPPTGLDPLVDEPPAEPEGVAEQKPPIREFIGSFTGWDEIAIERMFRKDFGELSKMMTGRAAAFVLLRRKTDVDDKGAFKQCMDMSLSGIDEMFDTTSEREKDDEDSVWPGGKA